MLDAVDSVAVSLAQVVSLEPDGAASGGGGPAATAARRRDSSSVATESGELAGESARSPVTSLPEATGSIRLHRSTNANTTTARKKNVKHFDNSAGPWLALSSHVRDPPWTVRRVRVTRANWGSVASSLSSGRRAGPGPSPPLPSPSVPSRRGGRGPVFGVSVNVHKKP